MGEEIGDEALPKFAELEARIETAFEALRRGDAAAPSPSPTAEVAAPAGATAERT
jgi:hypothetical protein